MLRARPAGAACIKPPASVDASTKGFDDSASDQDTHELSLTINVPSQTGRPLWQNSTGILIYGLETVPNALGDASPIFSRAPQGSEAGAGASNDTSPTTASGDWLGRSSLEVDVTTPSIVHWVQVFL